MRNKRVIGECRSWLNDMTYRSTLCVHKPRCFKTIVSKSKSNVNFCTMSILVSIDIYFFFHIFVY